MTAGPVLVVPIAYPRCFFHSAAFTADLFRSYSGVSTSGFQRRRLSSGRFRVRCERKDVEEVVRRGGGGDGKMGEKDGIAVVWFKQDLRTDDHPGLVQASSWNRIVVPVYVFDPRILSGISFSVDMIFF